MSHEMPFEPLVEGGKFPNRYIERSYYLRPHPDPLMLLNSI